MRNLKKFAEQENLMRKLFGNKPPYNVDALTQADVNDLAQTLDCNMSPENLCCDGEISAAQVRQRRKLFTSAFKELSQYATKKGFTLPKTYELY